MAKLNTNQATLSWVIGGIFAITALIQIWRMFKKTDVVHKLEHPEEMTHGLEKRIEPHKHSTNRR